MGFDLNFWIKLHRIAINSLLKLFLIFLSNKDSFGIDASKLLNTIEKNDSSSVIQ